MKRTKLFLTILLMIFFLSKDLLAQVSASPSILFIDKNSNTGVLTLNNSSDIDKEIELSCKFGYAKVDTSFQVIIEYKDSINAQKYDIGSSIKFFPQKLVLKSKTEQTVRLLLTNTAKLNEGTYWSRLVVKSKDVEKQIDSTFTDEISARFVLVTETVNIVFYEKGQVFTNLEFGKHKIVEDSLNYKLAIETERTGNSPYLGSVDVKVYDNLGKEITNKSARTAQYFNTPFIITLPREKYSAGKYKVELAFTNSRDDIPAEYRIPFKPIVKVIEFEIK
jgi:hypothetical protein